jgi:hypothetical protein
MKEAPRAGGAKDANSVAGLNIVEILQNNG